ncbi:putative choline dehydrogenase [Durotheca rogersii]|uniref:putative choline dehydrogenase n=1 Tax=Durotheca rogersii TaxID=419775 RepID=UPI00221F818C|nr:putative choline dehydrogenase [Durotheca rogersii]KAI5860686.1 putative choline dehydrogenase [Durotheca rogersii]
MAHLITSDPGVFNARSYDYLVIGGGTAGLALASRLAQDEGIKVGVLEAGNYHQGNPLIDIPGHFGSLVGNDEFDWKFETVPQEGLGGRKLPWPRGKVLGGTSALNFLVWNRAAKEDYDAWEKLGNPGWNWESLLPFFKKSETLTLPSQSHQDKHHSSVDPVFHGTSGPVSTSFSPWYAATHSFWRDTLQILGIKKNPSALNGSNTGSWTTIQSVDPVTATRSYSVTAYLGHNPQRSAEIEQPNLVILTGAQAQRILIERSGQGTLRATGAEYLHKSGVFTIEAGLEVLVAAGTIQSPQLLELSGIGSHEVLTKAGVEVKYENESVGRNLQDHLMTEITYELEPGIQTPEDLAEDPASKEAAEKLYLEEKDGIYRSTPSSMAYVPLKDLITGRKLSDLYEQIAAAEIPGLLPTQKELLLENLKHGSVGHVEFILHHGNSSAFVGERGKRYATIHQIQQYPFSRGQIHIRSPHASDKPAIDPAYYTPARLPRPASSEAGSFTPDLDIITAGTIFAAKIPLQPPLNSIIARRVFPPEEGEGAPGSEEDWRRFIRDTTVTDWHPVGTCAMLPERDGGVVNPKLQVYGVAGLRVADASIIPLHISSHLQATVYAIAEKAAAIIREDRLGQGRD